MSTENVNAKVKGEEKYIRPASGWLVLFLSLIGLVGGAALPIYMLANEQPDWWGLCFLIPMVSIIFMCGLFIVNPNESAVVTFFGKYVGTVIDNGFFFMNPPVSPVGEPAPFDKGAYYKSRRNHHGKENNEAGSAHGQRVHPPWP